MLPILRNHGLRCARPDETFGSLTRLLDDFLPDMLSWRHAGNLDVYEDDKNLYVEAELPGFNKDQIELTLDDGILHLKAEQKDEKEDKQENYFIRERRQANWARSIQLPVAVQEDEVAANYQDGVLKVTLAKKVEKQTHRIEVK
jgi:HSP20 family protein